jgi:hypothetical protein
MTFGNEHPMFYCESEVICLPCGAIMQLPAKVAGVVP